MLEIFILFVEYSKTPQFADFVPTKIVPQIVSVIVCSKWDRMVHNTVLTAEKRGPQIVGAQIAGVYCTRKSGTLLSNSHIVYCMRISKDKLESMQIEELREFVKT